MHDSLIDLNALCTDTVMHGRRIVRTSERRIGAFELDSPTLLDLGAEQVGVLIGGIRSEESMVNRIHILCEQDLAGTIAIATCSKALADSCYTAIGGLASARRRPDVYEKGCVAITTPEELRTIRPEQYESRPVIALILLDPLCILYQARGQSRSARGRNDRPRHIVRFRNAHRRDRWQPPLLLMTTKPPKSLNTMQMCAPFGLEAWWFVDGATLRIGPPCDAAPELSGSSRAELARAALPR